MSQAAPIFTCLACQVAFHSAELQRSHYRSDWHRYNLKRKMANLPPVEAENFAQRVLTQQAKSKEEAAEANVALRCEVCRKSYGSKNAYLSHMASKKHREKAKASLGESSPTVNAGSDDVPMASAGAETLTPTERQLKIRELNRALDEVETEEEMERLIQKKIKLSARLAPESCLFCVHTSDSFESNIEHMTQVHSFFIPDIEFMKDLPGMIKYLGEKVSVANVCLYCNGRGRGLRSLESVRDHMRHKGHCKIAYDDEIDILELSEFYDFSSTYADATAANADDEMELDTNGQIVLSRHRGDLASNTHGGGLTLTTDESELILPSGARIGHRDYLRYYRQRLQPSDTDNPALISRMLTEHADGDRPMTKAERKKMEKALILQQPKGRWALKNNHSYLETRTKHHFDTRVGIKANKLQRHFRAQILF
ncbi:C2H2 type zinc-finger-domain-containing protein [Dimargaris cristalligena]|uniref:C2H2 type zinc-finger-domain-containing protein n=1 Tax=Dimargaris cristalligena TaxID=215637 RepID=A0A4P9ZNY5_9FUNG|nr:C2H2 type zinc-finger-domain-containing protein [Dimargaris cristalligena]|eukprot:RKP34050.1 C2H2 type zinc-finger-domain-containing protein [Dimargaris cristalligena]